MRTYVEFGLKSFSSNLAYRSEVWLQTLGNVVAILIQVAIWRAVIGSSGADGISLDQMITYSILNTLLLTLLLTNISGKVNDSLRTGSIAGDLIRPLSFPLYLLADGLGGVLYKFVFVAAPSFVVAWLAFGFLPPASAAHFAAFLAALALALLISFLLGYLISLIAFWFLTHFALDWTLGGLMTVFSGSFLPLWFFPEPWATVAHALPFQYLGYVPAALYMGVIPPSGIALALMTGLAWAAGLWALVRLLWWRAMRRLVVQGG